MARSKERAFSFLVRLKGGQPKLLRRGPTFGVVGDPSRRW